MAFERFTTLAQEALAAAQGRAVRSEHGQISPLHLLVTLLEDDDSVAASILRKAGRDDRRILTVAEAELNRMPVVKGGSTQGGTALQQVLADSERTAQTMGDQYVSCEHLLLSLAGVDGDAKKVLVDCGTDATQIRAAIAAVRKSSGVENVTDPGAEGNYEALAKYAVDLNEAASAGKIDPVIGRDEEIRRCMQVLSRRTKNNPVLIGEPGVGKTAIAEGLAIRIVERRLPGLRCATRRVMALDVGAHCSPARSFAASSRNASRPCLREVSRQRGPRSSSSSTNSTPSSAPARRKAPSVPAICSSPPWHEVNCGRSVPPRSTSIAMHIEKDPAFERRFQPVLRRRTRRRRHHRHSSWAASSATKRTTACGSRTAR